MAAIGSRETPELGRTQKLRRLPLGEMCVARARDRLLSCHILILLYDCLIYKNVQMEVIKRTMNNFGIDIDAARWNKRI
jgi:hypothetical protein